MRYGSKEELLRAITTEHAALMETLNQIPASRYTNPGVWGDDWTIADLVAHLAEWQRLLLRWVAEGARGVQPEMPAPGFTWRETPRLNRAIWKKYRDRPVEESMAEFSATHAEVLAYVTGLPESRILEPGHFGWTGKNALVTYVGANTASHYRFAQRVLRRWLRAAPQPPLPS